MKFKLIQPVWSGVCRPPVLGCLLIALPLGSPTLGFAHDPGLSTAAIRLAPGEVEAVLTFALKDAEQLAGLGDGAAAPASLANSMSGQARLIGVVRDEFLVELDGRQAKPASAACGLDAQGNSSISLSFPGVRFSSLGVESKLISRLAPGHRQFLTIQRGAGKPIFEQLLSAKRDSASLPLSFEEGAETAGSVPSFFSFLQLGIKHILTGYDHLLFLGALLIVTRNGASSLKIITCFTLAHSITLAAATLDLVHVPSRVVEPLIAASIVYVGVENLLCRGTPGKRWRLTFLFGLIHGLGFASALRELGVGANGGGIAVPLLSFNLGVELGQIMVAALFLPLVWRYKDRPAFGHRWVPAGSSLVALAGAYWLIARVCSG